MLEELYKNLLDKFMEKTPRSRELYREAQKRLPMGVTYHIRFFEPYPFYVSRARGSKIFDVDGNTYTDYWVGHGALILGHAPRRVIERVKEQLDRGSHWGFEHEYAYKLADKITSHLPGVEMIRFTNSGTEANMYAIRLIRAYTGKKKIVKFTGGWHGGYDQLHLGFKPDEYLGSGGLPPETVSHTILAKFNDIEDTENIFRSYGREIAGIIIEPIQGAAGIIPAEREFLKRIRELCDYYGSLLVYDEVITGYRLGLGGAQEYYGVEADVVVLGKIIGGGFPIGALTSRREIMERLDYRRKWTLEEKSFHGGTFAGNPVSMVAGLATLEELEKPGFYDSLKNTTDILAGELLRVSRDYKLDISITSAPSMVGIHFTHREPKNIEEVVSMRYEPLLNRVFQKYSLVRGIVFLTEDITHLLLSSSHTREDISYFVEVFREFLELVEKYIERK